MAYENKSECKDDESRRKEYQRLYSELFITPEGENLDDKAKAEFSEKFAKKLISGLMEIALMYRKQLYSVYESMMKGMEIDS